MASSLPTWSFMGQHVMETRGSAQSASKPPQSKPRNALRKNDSIASNKRKYFGGCRKGGGGDYGFGKELEDATCSARAFRLGKTSSLDCALCEMCEMSCHSLDECETWLIKQLLDGQVPQATVHTFNIMITACMRVGRIECAEKWLKTMCNMGFRPNKHTFHSMLSHGDCVCDLSQPKRLVQLMSEMGFGSDTLYNKLIKACSHQHDIVLCESLVSAMLSDGREPSVDTINAVIHACAQAGNLDRVEYYVEFLRGQGMTPNLITYNSIINACAEKCDPTAAILWLIRMEEAGLQPNEVTFGTICKAYSRLGDMASIERIISAFEESGVAANEYLYAALISACGVAQPPDPLRAEQTLVTMAAKNLRIGSVKRSLLTVLPADRVVELYSVLQVKL